MIGRDDEVKEMHNEENPSLLSGMVSGKWLDAQSFPPLEYSVPGIIPEGFGLLVGPPKAGKSWMVAAIGLAVAQGGIVLGRIHVPRRPVLYLALEDGHRRLQSRFRRITGGQPIPGIHVITRAKPIEILPMIQEYLQACGDQQPLVILDTLGKARPRRSAGSDSYQEDYDYGVRLKDTIDASPGAALLAVHHSRKAESADFVDAVSGTHGITGAADFVIVLARKRLQDNGLLSVTGRDVAEAEYAVRTDKGLWSLDGADLAGAAQTAQARRAEHQLGDRALEVLALVSSRAETRAGDLAEIGITGEQGRVYLNRLAESGRIRKIGRGVYGPGTDPSGSNSVTTVTSVTSDECLPGTGNVTDITDVTPTRRCSCGQRLETLASIRAGQCAECRTDQNP